MKNIRTYFLALVAAVCFAATPVLMLPGCSSTPEKIAFQTTSTTAITVDAAMTAWNNYVTQFHPPGSEEQAVKDAFEKYQASALIVADVGKAVAEGAGSQAKLDVAIQAAAASLGDLVNLIQKFGVSVTPTK